MRFMITIFALLASIAILTQASPVPEKEVHLSIPHLIAEKVIPDYQDPHKIFKKEYAEAMFDLRTCIKACEKALGKGVSDKVQNRINDIIKGADNMEGVAIDFIISRL
ncbi:10481_t:CDS:2 [Cetraspora pellucida]|uniref:10481_t:CDS:1 n=1 Tax=Cetraspora pellucida TaxID=1433469 RepID=A0A9N9IVQ6_9GLOM|nr:10481_t:CDS:2 [Cetraspora pellucida]